MTTWDCNKMNEYQKKYRENNREVLLKRQKVYRENHREERRKYQQEYRERPGVKERELEASRKYYAELSVDQKRVWFKQRRDKEREKRKSSIDISKSSPNKSWPRGCKTLIKKHHDDLINDPERLTTEFLINIIGCKCNRE